MLGCCQLFLLFFPLLVISIRHVRATDTVPENKERSVVPHVVRMVIVVDIGPRAEGKISEGYEPEIVPTVSINALR